MSRQKLGQHFLSSLTWRQRIAQTLPAAPDSTWIEIGAGHGEMTELLAPRAHRIIAIETDPALASSLRTRFAQTPNVEIIESDILSVDFATIASAPSASDLRKGTVSTVPNSGLLNGALAPEVSRSADVSCAQPPSREHFRVYGNLPYYITSPILTHLFRFAAQIESIHIVIQWEVARRIVATPGHREYAYLSALCQYFTRPEIVLRIPPGAFRPPPKVNSALVAMRLPGGRANLSIANDQAFLEFLQHSFAQKRKTLRNNLKSIFSDEQIAHALAACKLTASARAEELSLRQFAKLFHLLAAEK
ncbi:MAG TPA: rRNA adenine dimethyltransferase family protein [Candidatus Acidoferrales bacterium]|nr:rRNA adenine dimethyltransferase family protein [Candidatus Acidoferrales bacterium]